jgi:hypothetical protein
VGELGLVRPGQGPLRPRPDVRPPGREPQDPSPQTFANTFTTSTIDLSGLRELYVHSSLSDYGTLSSIGMRDIIAVISVDSDWGNMVYYRPVGLSDQEVIQLPDNGVPTNIRIYLTDSYGTILPVASASQYVFVQLSIVPYQTMKKRACCAGATSRTP